MNILKDSSKKLYFFDGGTGTLLQEKGMPAGALPELLNITAPEMIFEIHSDYVKSGADIIKTNTFGANELKLSGSGKEVEEIVSAAVKIAKKAAAGKAYTALDIGPSGKLLAPTGDLPFEKAVEIFKRMIRAGKGTDIILIETMSDIYEAKAALIAAKEESSLPVAVTLSFDERGRLLTGADIKTCVGVLEGLGADAVGMNCGFGPDRMEKLLPEFVKYSSLPIIANPNAGLPAKINGKTVFDVSPDEFATDMERMINAGVCIAGGCCGTTPAHIKKMVDKCKSIRVKTPEKKNFCYVTSYSHATDISFERPVIIGERINPTGKKRLKQALIENDTGYILNEALSQADAGADILDVNTGINEIDQKEVLPKVISEIQSVTDLPLQIDTSDIPSMERALRVYNGKAMINSVNGKKESMDAVFPLVKKYGGVVVALCLDESGIPETAEGRFEIAKNILKEAKKYGISENDIVFDPLAMTISTDSENANTTLKTLSLIRNKLKANTVLGVSNISFGLPAREKINSTFFALALNSGLSAGIINPLSDAMTSVYDSYLALSGKDKSCEKYTLKYSSEKAEKAVSQTGETSLYDAVLKGLREPAAELAKKALETEKPLDIIDKTLIPALNTAGERFEKKTLFLPQLLMCAEAAKSAFDVLKVYIAEKGLKEASKGKIILATVKGDIHDIGKNIVKVLLENYGYDVIDLGKDVDYGIIAERAVKEKIKLVGLSALMTTTVDNMETTIKLLKEKCDCRIVVGGAVLNKEYAKSIGADCYAKDAMETVRYANLIFEQ